ncbi:hypothetical protein V8E36_001303 [Tilletia maclaganii]
MPVPHGVVVRACLSLWCEREIVLMCAELGRSNGGHTPHQEREQESKVVLVDILTDPGFGPSPFPICSHLLSLLLPYHHFLLAVYLASRRPPSTHQPQTTHGQEETRQTTAGSHRRLASFVYPRERVALFGDRLDRAAQCSYTSSTRPARTNANHGLLIFFPLSLSLLPLSLTRTTFGTGSGGDCGYPERWKALSPWIYSRW